MNTVPSVTEQAVDGFVEIDPQYFWVARRDFQLYLVFVLRILVALARNRVGVGQGWLDCAQFMRAERRKPQLAQRHDLAAQKRECARIMRVAKFLAESSDCRVKMPSVEEQDFHKPQWL